MQVSSGGSAPLFVRKIHQVGNLFSDSAIVIDRAFFHAVGPYNRISDLFAAPAAAPAINFYGVHLRFFFRFFYGVDLRYASHTPSLN